MTKMFPSVSQFQPVARPASHGMKDVAELSARAPAAPAAPAARSACWAQMETNTPRLQLAGPLVSSQARVQVCVGAGSPGPLAAPT